MLVKGSVVPSAWTPAPEDTMNELKEKLSIADFKSFKGGDFSSVRDRITQAETALGGKASITALEGVKTALDTKADKSALGGFPTRAELTNTLRGYPTLDTFTSGLASKVDKTTLGDYPRKTEIEETLRGFTTKEDYTEGVSAIRQDLSTKADREEVDAGLHTLDAKTSYLDGAIRQAQLDTNMALSNQAKENNNKFGRLWKGALSPEQREQLLALSSTLPSLRSSTGAVEGIKLQQYIALGNEKGNVTAYLSGVDTSLQAVLKAGVSNFGEKYESEEVAINHNGTGHLGGLYFQGDRIDFRKGVSETPYLSIGSGTQDHITYFVQKARTDDTPINRSSYTISKSNNYILSDYFDAPADGTRVTITIDYLSADVYDYNKNGSNKLQLTLGGERLGEWVGEFKFVHIPPSGVVGDYGRTETKKTPRVVEGVSFSRYVKKGRHTLKIEITGRNGSAVIKGLKLHRYFDAGLRKSYITPDGIRIFGSATRYFDIDTDYYERNSENSGTWGFGHGIGPIQGPNNFTARVKGGFKADRIEADEVVPSFGGAVLCGGLVHSSGNIDPSFGKYKLMAGRSDPYAYYNRNNSTIYVYHGIGNTNYVPIVTSCAGAWGDVPQVVSVESNRFGVKFINSNNEPSLYWDFNFVCYRGD